MNRYRKLSILFSLSLAGCAVDAGDGAASNEEAGELDSALCRSALTTAQQASALKLIDDICGDTWCEGDNNFAFKRLSCRAPSPHAANGGSCTLALEIIPRTEPPVRYSRSCTTHGYQGFESLVTTSQSGYQSLRWDYYLALSDCINRLEAELPPS